jgi:hypothetical protein
VEIEQRVVDHAELGQGLRRSECELDRDLVDVIVDADRGDPEPHGRAQKANAQHARNPQQDLADDTHDANSVAPTGRRSMTDC